MVNLRYNLELLTQNKRKFNKTIQTTMNLIDQLKNLLTLIYVQPMFQIIILTSRILAVSLMRDLRSQSSKYRCFLEQQMSPKINQVRQETKKYQSNKLLRMKEKSSKNDLEKISRALKKKIVEDSVSSKK